jgi:N-terminal acetyltransferase B complex non-catalytic subunit
VIDHGHFYIRRIVFSIRSQRKQKEVFEFCTTNSNDQALRCYIQCCHPAVVERAKGLAIILGLLDQADKRYTIDELELYDESISALFPGNRGFETTQICRLRAEAVKADPKDEKLSIACFKACLKRDNIEFAQQVSPPRTTF